MVDQLSSKIIGGNCHIYPTRIQRGYLQICSARLGAAVTWIGQDAESREEGTDDHEGWLVSHYDATSRGGGRSEIDGEWTAGHDINTGREGFASRSACAFLAPFPPSSIPQNLGVASKVTTLTMNSMFFFTGFLLHLQAVFRVTEKNTTVDVG